LKSRNNRKVFIFVILILLSLFVFFVRPAEAEARSVTRFQLSPSVGFMTLGIDLNVFHDFPSGFSVGVFNTGVFPLMESVAGLRVNIDMYDTLLGLAGYNVRFFDGILSLGFYGALGVEFAVINETIDNPEYGINRSYSAFDVLFETGLLSTFELYFTRFLAMNINLYLSAIEVRKSLLSLGVSIAIDFGLNASLPVMEKKRRSSKSP